MSRLCTDCGIRYKQCHGLCRTCERKAGRARTTFEREADTVAKRAARYTAQPPPAPVLRDPATRVVDGIAYAVVWDGTEQP